MLNTIAELELIAPAEVINAAQQVVRFFGAYVKATNDGATIDDSWPTDIERPMPQLKAAMREDLGEAPLADDAEPGSSGELGEAGSDSASPEPGPIQPPSGAPPEPGSDRLRRSEDVRPVHRPMPMMPGSDPVTSRQGEQADEQGDKREG